MWECMTRGGRTLVILVLVESKAVVDEEPTVALASVTIGRDV